MTQKTIHSMVGWLPYGVDDDSIIFRSSLTSEAAFTSPEIGAAVGLNVVGTGGVWDSFKGFNPKEATYLKIDDLTGYADCDNGYQMSFEIEREWLCPYVNDLTNGVVADGDVFTDEIFVASNGSSGYSYQMRRDAASSTIRIDNSGAALTGYFTYSHGKRDFITVNVGYRSGYGSRMIMAIDGCVLATRISTDANVAEVIRDIFIGGKATVQMVADHYIRNLQISNRAPVFPMHPRLARVGVLSDSLFNSDDQSSGNYKDNQPGWVIRRELAKRGLFCGNHLNFTASGAMYVDIQAGYTMQDTGGQDLSNRIPTLLAEKPQIVLLKVGANDISAAGITVDATWNTDLEAFCDEILAGASVTNLIVGTISSLIGDTEQHIASRITKLAQANTYINALPDYDSRISIADNFADLGGHTPDLNTFKGQIVGYVQEGNDLHCAGLGHYLMGKSYAEAILRIL